MFPHSDIAPDDGTQKNLPKEFALKKSVIQSHCAMTSQFMHLRYLLISLHAMSVPVGYESRELGGIRSAVATPDPA